MALRQVLEEIEDTARATLSSITLDTMIKLIQRQRTRWVGRQAPDLALRTVGL